MRFFFFHLQCEISEIIMIQQLWSRCCEKLLNLLQFIKQFVYNARIFWNMDITEHFCKFFEVELIIIESIKHPTQFAINPEPMYSAAEKLLKLPGLKRVRYNHLGDFYHSNVFIETVIFDWCVLKLWRLLRVHIFCFTAGILDARFIHFDIIDTLIFI